MTKVVILGGGPAGLGAAYELARNQRAEVTLIERNAVVGGNAGSFTLADVRVDYGSHRLHPSCDPQILAEIRGLLGDDLLDRPRHGRIRLQGRWIHFPLKPIDLAFRLPPSFALKVARDILAKPFSTRDKAAEPSFSASLAAGLGPTIAEDFYIPYARKIWGVDPDELDAVQAARRVSANSPGKLVRKVLNAVPGLKPQGAGRFFYPRGGFGRISEAYAAAASDAGADIRLNTSVSEVRLPDFDSSRPRGATACEVVVEHFGSAETIAADYIWSTIPISVLAGAAQPAAPLEVLEAAKRVEFRAMLLVYLVLEQDQFTEFDAHYFPEANVAVTRISEPKNYSDSDIPSGRTVLCAELPCAAGGPEWSASDEELGALVRSALENAGLPVRSRVAEVAVRRLAQAYPIYRKGYDTHFARLDAWAEAIPRLLSFGRQGLFAHDNTHHALYMANAACRCLSADGGFDLARWQDYRRIFATHVVED